MRADREPIKAFPRTVAKRKESNELLIAAFIHCELCLSELPPDQSPKEWARTQAGWTEDGLQVWCSRHECNVVHIDFQGQCHPGDLTRRL